MKKFRLLSFLCLLVIGWGNAWADDVYANSYKGEYPYTWDFTNWTSTIDAQVTVEGETKTIQAHGWYYDTDHFGYNTNSGSNYAYMYKDNQPVMSLVGSTNSGGNMTSYIYVPETKGLKIFPGLKNNVVQYSRVNYYTDGTGISIYASSIVIPNLSYGNKVKFYTNNAHNSFTIIGFYGTDYAVTKGRGGEIEFEVPAEWTYGSEATFYINGNSSCKITKIEVTKSPAIADWNYVRVGASNSSYENYKDDFNNGACTLSADAISFFSGRFQIKDANGDKINISKLVEGNTGSLGNYFEITSSDGNIIDVSNATFSVTSGDDYIMVSGVSLLSKGEATLTMTYKGTNAFDASSVSTMVTIEGVPAQFDLYNETWDFSEIYIDNTDNNLRKYLKLKNASFDTNVPCTVEYDDEEETHAVTLKSFRYYDPSRLDIYIAPNKLGTCTFKVTYPGDAVHNPTVYYFDVTVKQHIADLKWVDGSGNDVEKITTSTTSGSLPNAPILKQYKDYEEYTTGYNLIYSSTDETVATVNSSGSVTIVGAGITTIQATLVPQKKVVNGITHYYYNEAADSYTLVVTNGSTSGTQPRIIWVTAVGYNFESNYYSHARGSYMGQKFADEGKYVGYEAPYGNNVFVSAIAIKSTVTDADLATRGILPIPNSEYPNHYYVMDDPNNTYWNKGGWRAYNTKCIPANWRFNESDDYQNDITYLVSNRDQIRTEEKREGEGGNAWGIHVPTSTYVINPAYPDKNPLLVYAYIKGYDAYSTTPVLVTPGKLQLRFVPDHNTVNQGKSIMPYVNCPDLRMEDVNKIYLTYNCEDILAVPNDNKIVYETGKTTTEDIAKYLKIVTSNDTIWVNPNGKRYNDDGTPVTTNIKEVKAVTWLRGINPEIIGKAEGNCTVTLHLESDMYETATADYNVTVLPSGQQMFHWEMNDKVEGEGENKKHVDDKTMKTIKITQGDFVYMPGIVGNANGNTQYSQPEQYKYMYGIQNGVVIMNYKGYFPGEGIPNYYVSYSPNGNPSVPVSNTTTNQPAIVTWAIGLGDYWRYDSLMVYGNEPGVMYLCAQDAQTGQTCTPIKIEVLKSVGDEGDLLDQKHDELDGMSYPFTWDFEHIDMTEYIKDASNTTDGNGGTYWRQAWNDVYKQGEEPTDKAYNRDYRNKMDYYQYNGGFNADWDDKDGNKKSRQRWFKDIHVNGKYAPEFKGMMLNLAGLEYWEQKYQRFLIHEDGDYIRFQGGPIFVQLPGFGLLAKKGGIEDGTRAHDNYIGSTHNHINTAKYNVNEGYTKLLSVDNEHNVNINYPVQTTNASGQARDYRNNKVRFVIKARGGRTVESTDETPNNNGSSQFHIGGASMLNEALDVNDINWKQGVHNGYSYYNLNKNETKVYIVELDPYDPELQDHIYLMFNNDVDVYWMAITNEPRNILSDFDGVTYAYPKDIDMDKTNQTLAQQTTEGIYTKATEDGKYALASVGEHTIKNVYQVGSDEPGEGTKVQLKAYTVSSFDPESQSVSLSEIEGNIPKNEGVMLYTEPRMSTLAAAGGHIPGLTAEHYDRGATAYSKWVTRSKIVNGETVYYDEEVFEIAPDSTYKNNMYNNSHNYYTFPLYFIAMAENMSKENYEKIAPVSTGSAVDPSIGSGHVTTDNLLRPVTYGSVLPMDYTYQDTKLINFGYNNEFICRKLVYQEMSNGEWVQTKEMADPYIKDNTGSSNEHEDMYYYRIGIDNAKFYRINTSLLNHHNRSAYLTLTWDEYKVNTVGKPINMGSTSSQPSQKDLDNDINNGATLPGSPAVKSPIRFSPSYNPVDILFDSEKPEEQLVSEDAGIPDGIDEVEHSSGDDKVYNLNGVQVNTLSKGIYIINGKKVVVK